MRFVKYISYPAGGEHLAANYYVDEFISISVEETSLLGLDPSEQLKLDEQDSIIPNSISKSPQAIIEFAIAAYAYLNSSCENDRTYRGVFAVFNDQDNEFHNNELTNLVSITVKKSELQIMKSQKMLMMKWTKTLSPDLIERLKIMVKLTLVKVFKTLKKKRKFRNSTNLKIGNPGNDLLQQLNMKCSDKTSSGKLSKLIRASKTNTPTRNTGSTSTHPIGDFHWNKGNYFWAKFSR